MTYQFGNKETQRLDITLGDVIKAIPPKFVKILTGKNAKILLDTVFKQTKERKLDFLLELEDSSIFHLEIQSTNDKNMPYRMLEYYLLITSKYNNRNIIQKVLYVGDEPLNMEGSIELPNLHFKYELLDIKDISCKELIESPDLNDKILAALCKIENPENYLLIIFDILSNIPERERKDYIVKLLTVLDFRPKLKEVALTLKEENKMPLTITREMIEKDPFYKKGLEEAYKKNIIKLYTKKSFTPEEIAEILDVSLDFVKETLREKDNLKKDK
ncbi:MAG: flagellar biosynthesis/type III secretory pathway protein [Hydrogenothermaceae bacterium]|nr:flagellar biosynthesis/type III secretory pathway protein [Hydrogenothermaceae bacterium]